MQSRAVYLSIESSSLHTLRDRKALITDRIASDTRSIAVHFSPLLNLTFEGREKGKAFVECIVDWLEYSRDGWNQIKLSRRIWTDLRIRM